MVKCSFCGNDLPVGGGILYAKRDGTTFYFCSNKCDKNMILLGRKPAKTKWTNAHMKLRETLKSAKEDNKKEIKTEKKENKK